jgi:uncharacterized membrane protein
MQTHSDGPPQPKGPSARTAGVLLGLGLGGFVDGIVLHQVLQWHHMVSEVDGLGPTDLGNLQLNVAADGLFHALTWILVFVGVLALAEISRSGRQVSRITLLGWMAVGWGAFNLVEGVINHHILQIHRVRPAAENPAAYDIGFLVLGALLVLGGLAVQRLDSGDRPEGEMAGSKGEALDERPI